MIRAVPARILIDGNNVIGSRPDGWWRDRPGATRRLVDQLGAWAEREARDVLVVFDGEPPAALPSPPRVDVRFAERGGRDAADDVIAALVADAVAPETLQVVTSDAALARRVRAHGAAVLGAGAFRDALGRHGAAARRRGRAARAADTSGGGVRHHAARMPGFGHTLATARPVDGGVLIYSLGQAGFALRGAETLVLIDPWLSTALEEDEGITRPTPPPLRPEEVEAADLVCVTHEHGDHLDPRTLAAIALQAPEAIFLAPAPAVALVEAAGVPHARVHPAHADVALEAAGARVTAVAAAHELHPDAFGGYRFWRDERGDHRALGYLVELEDRAVFHSGDTIWWPGLADALRALEPDVAILPINGRDAMREARGLWGNLNADEAAALAVAAGVPAVIPCHFDGVAGNLGDPDAFVRALAEQSDGIAAHVLLPGGCLAI